jgi:hypothetical protein
LDAANSTGISARKPDLALSAHVERDGGFAFPGVAVVMTFSRIPLQGRSTVASWADA